MAVVKEDQIEQLLRRSLTEQGVLDQVSEIELFPTPEGILTEVVLRDASLLEQARQAVENVEKDLGSERLSLLSTIRALWKVEKLEKVQVSSPAGVPPELVGALFRASLKSGLRHQEVWVAVTSSAQHVLRPLATTDEAWLGLIKAYLEHRLSIGGAGYWDPVAEQKLELGENSAHYLRWRPYEQLKGSVNRAFRSLTSSRSFLQQFITMGKSARDFSHVLEELTGPGGAIARGERVPVSNFDLYQMLLDSEKVELRQYYFQKLASAGSEAPELKRDFPKVFAD